MTTKDINAESVAALLEKWDVSGATHSEGCEFDHVVCALHKIARAYLEAVKENAALRAEIQARNEDEAGADI